MAGKSSSVQVVNDEVNDDDAEAAAGEDDAAGQSLNLVTTGVLLSHTTFVVLFFAQVGTPITSQHHLLPPAKSHASQLGLLK